MEKYIHKHHEDGGLAPEPGMSLSNVTLVHDGEYSLSVRIKLPSLDQHFLVIVSPYWKSELTVHTMFQTEERADDHDS